MISTMDDVGRTNFNFPKIDLSKENVPNSHRIIRYFNITSDGRDTNSIPQLIDLTDDSSKECYSNIPVIDLTQDNEQFLNNTIPVIDLIRENDQFLKNGIPVIDLTDDHAKDIANQMYCVDLTNDASSFNLSNQYFDISSNASNGDQYTNTSRDIINNGQDFITNIPAVANDQEWNNRIPDIDMANGDIQDITHQFESIDLRYSKQQKINDSIPSIELAVDSDQNIDTNITGVNLSSYKDYNNIRRPVKDLTRNEVNIIRNSEDVEMQDIETMAINNLTTNLQETVSENLSVNHRDDASKNNFLKCNETSNMKLIHVGISCRMQPHCRRKGTTSPNDPLTNISEQKDPIRPRRSEKIHHNTALDFMKPAHHPVPLRHSLGRSTVNTSKNVPIEYIEDSEGQFHALTVSSVIRRKKSKSEEYISKKNSPESLEPSSSKADIVSSDTFIYFFLKIWNFVCYWIFKIILRFIEFFVN